jgi:hypothetical protein
MRPRGLDDTAVARRGFLGASENRLRGRVGECRMNIRLRLW